MNDFMRTITRVTLMAGLLAGCGVEKLPDESGGGGGIPTAVQERFDTYCTQPACHAALPPVLTPGASAAILTGMATTGVRYVEIGNVPGSYLATKILPDAPDRVGTIMPVPGNEPLPPEDIAIIIGWIAGTPLPGGDDGDTEGDTETGTGGDSDTGSDPTGASNDDDTGMDTGTGGSDTGGPALKLCGINDFDPAATSPIDAMVPADVKLVVENNCGCHYTSENVMIPYTGTMVLETLQDFQTNAELLLGRVSPTPPLMPPAYACETGEGPITAEDQAILVDWLNAGAPAG